MPYLSTETTPLTKRHRKKRKETWLNPRKNSCGDALLVSPEVIGPVRVRVLIVCCKDAGRSSITQGSRRTPIALNTTFFPSAFRTSLIRSQTTLTHSDMRGLISSNLFMRPMTNGRSNLKSDTKIGIFCTFSFVQISLTPARSSRLAKPLQTAEAPHLADHHQIVHVHTVCNMPGKTIDDHLCGPRVVIVSLRLQSTLTLPERVRLLQQLSTASLQSATHPFESLCHPGL